MRFAFSSSSRSRGTVAALFATGLALAGCDGSSPGLGDDGDAAPAPIAHDAGPRADAAPSPGPDSSTTPPRDSGVIDAGSDTAPSPPLDTDGDGTPDATDCAPADSSAWQTLSFAFRDVDGDGFTVAQAGTLCAGAALPAGYATVASGDDCNDADPSVHAPVAFYPDTDGDGTGAGAPVSICVSNPPAGYAATGTDCAPADAAAWQTLSYSYRDADGDGVTVPESGQRCTGFALPTGYALTGNGDDCDDANPKIFASVTVYADTDGDGVGAGNPTTMCTDGTAPAGASLASTDCAPADKTKWQTLTYAFVDQDGDGATVPASGSQCAGASLAPPYYATAQGNDCDDTNKALTHWDVVWPDKDADGAGAGAYVFKCDGDAIPAGYSRYGDDENDGDAKVGPLPAEDILDLVLN